jgi:hypothetical protein
MESLVNGDGVACLGKIACAGQTCRAGTNNCHLVTVGFGLHGSFGSVLVVVIGNKTLQTADAYGLALDAADALGLTLGFLRANTTANCGERGGEGDHLICTLEIALLHLLDELRNRYVYGATLYTNGVLTVETTVCLVDCLLCGVTESNFLKIARTNLGLLCGHRILFQRHIRHITVPPS